MKTMNKKHAFQIILFAFVVSMILPFATSCKKENLDSSIEVSSDTLFFNDNQRKFLFLSNNSTKECSYSFKSIPDWITVNPSYGKFYSGDTEIVSVIADISSLSSGTTVDQMVLKSNLGNHTITLVAQKGYPTEFSLPDSLLFPAGIDVVTLTLKNTGHKELSYYISPSSYYIDLNTYEGYLQLNEQVEIEVHIEREYLSGSQYLNFYINEESYCVPIVLEEFNYSVNDELFFGSDDNNATLSIRNTGTTNFLYSVEASTNYITLSPNTAGNLSSNQQADINVSIDKDAILTNHIEPSLNVTINDIHIDVPIVIERKIMLSKDIVDAEYAKATDLLVYVSDDMTLNIFHPSSGTTDVVNLAHVPVSVSLSMDGTKAAVGHDAHMSYVDLLSKQLINTHDITCKAGDIVLANNGWAYAFPTSGYEIHCVNLADPNSIETTSTSYLIYHGTKAKIHPSEKYIYGADNGLSPMDIEKYDIQNGTASRLYDSPYHGDYPMGGDLWLTEDGDRVITRGGGVYKTSELQENDMLYNGRISIPNINYPYCPCIDHSKTNNEFYILIRPYYDEPKAPFVYIVNSENLTFKNTISLEKYQVSDYQGNTTLYEAEPYFAFAHSNGEKLFVLTKAIGSGLVHEWALQIFDIGE